MSSKKIIRPKISKIHVGGTSEPLENKVEQLVSRMITKHMRAQKLNVNWARSAQAYCHTLIYGGKIPSHLKLDEQSKQLVQDLTEQAAKQRGFTLPRRPGDQPIKKARKKK